MASLQGRVGAGRYISGSQVDIALDRHGGVVTSAIYGRYTEAVIRGQVFGGATAAAGVAPGTALGTTGAHSLVNPAGSGVYTAVLQSSMGYVSGTLGAGMVVYAANVNPIAAAVTGTDITVRNMLLGGARSDGQTIALTTSTLPVAPDIIRPAFLLDASLATTAAVGAKPMVDYVDGAIVLAPGSTLTLHGIAAAGSSPRVVFGNIWAELPA